MISTSMTCLARRLVFLLVAVAIGIGPAIGEARAQTSADLSISAGIVSDKPSVTLTICDSTAHFGDSLSAIGDTTAIVPGPDGDGIEAYRDSAGTGTIYVWVPSCVRAFQPPERGPFMLIQTTAPIDLASCVTPKKGTSSASLDDLSLAYARPASGPGFPLTPGNGLPAPAFPVPGVCGQFSTTTEIQGPQYLIISFFLLLHVDQNTTSGTFSTMLRWTVTT